MNGVRVSLCLGSFLCRKSSTSYVKAHPEIAALLMPPSTDNALRARSIALDLPTDYYDLYEHIDGEDEASDGVFGLLRSLPLATSLASKVTAKDELNDRQTGVQYDLFVPVLTTPGRELIGYAKRGTEWDFVEYDLWPTHYQPNTLSEFMDGFLQKLHEEGFAVEDGINRLIDIDEM